MAPSIGFSEARSVAILGSTGSIGCSTLDLIAREPEAYRVEALTGHRNWKLLARQAQETGARFVAIGDPAFYRPLKEALGATDCEIAAGADAVDEAARRPADWVMAAIVGAAGLAPTLSAVRRGATVALANKEVLVCAGDLFNAEVADHGATLLPVDSEHNAIYQVFDFARPAAIEKIILTASGGPFRTWGRPEMASVTPAQAVKHPNWSMGAKISIDSATMMNKGLELIEAYHLFGVGHERIEIVVHPQSVIHSLVAYVDGSVLAQLGSPDMRTPIAFTLAWPSRMKSPSPRLDLAALGQLTFEAPDPARFPALALARAALAAGGSAPAVLNAANEIAVQAFLDGAIGFLDIAAIVEATLEAVPVGTVSTLTDVHNFDKQARDTASRLVRLRAAPLVVLA
jgi:1-deoxy-D-xylulose-5-phosphate reductoisomerase